MRLLGILLFFMSLFLATQPGPAQSRPSSKPVIIQDTDIAEGITGDEDSQKPRERDPDLAKSNIEIGNFYYKRKNYGAAIDRYLTAIEYLPDSVKAYKSLVKAYEALIDLDEDFLDSEKESGQVPKAIDSFKRYLKIYPDSERCSDFREKLSMLEKKAAKPADESTAR